MLTGMAGVGCDICSCALADLTSVILIWQQEVRSLLIEARGTAPKAF